MNKLTLPLIALVCIVPISAFADNVNLDYSNFYKYHLVKLGDTVIFTNTDSTTHSIQGTDKQGNEITTGPIKPNDQVTITFQNTGDFDFYDSLSPSNVGILEVYNASGDLTKSDLQNQSVVNGFASKAVPIFGYSNSTQVINSVISQPVVQSSSSTNQPVVTPTTQTNSTNQPVSNPTPTVQNGWQNSTLPTPPNQSHDEQPITQTTTQAPQQPITQPTQQTKQTNQPITTTSDHVWLFSQNVLNQCNSIRASLGLPPLETIMIITVIAK